MARSGNNKLFLPKLHGSCRFAPAQVSSVTSRNLALRAKPGIFWAASSATRLCPEEFWKIEIEHDFSCYEDVPNSDHDLFHTQILKIRIPRSFLVIKWLSKCCWRDQQLQPGRALWNINFVRSETSTLILPELLTRVTSKYGWDTLIFRSWFVGQY